MTKRHILEPSGLRSLCNRPSAELADPIRYPPSPKRRYALATEGISILCVRCQRSLAKDTDIPLRRKP